MKNIPERSLSYLSRLAIDEAFYFEQREFFIHNYVELNYPARLLEFSEKEMWSKYNDYDHINDVFVNYKATFYDHHVQNIWMDYRIEMPVGAERQEYQNNYLQALQEVAENLKGKKDSREYLRSELLKLKTKILEHNKTPGIRNKSYSIEKKYYSALRYIFKELKKHKYILGNIDDWLAIFNASEYPKEKNLRWIDISQKANGTTNKATLLHLFIEITSYTNVGFQHGLKIINSFFMDHDGNDIKNLKESKYDLKSNLQNNPRFSHLNKIIASAFNK